MSKQKAALGKRRKKNFRSIEWIGGVGTLPGLITGEGKPHRAEGLFWLNADGMVLGSTAAKPGELLPTACEFLQSIIDRPMWGRPHAPTRVRVASPALADALREGRPGLDVVCAPTPEFDEMFSQLQADMHEQAEADYSYLSPEISADAMASFFEAAAELYRAKPWEVVPDDKSLFSVTIEQLGVRDMALSVIGQMEESFGLVLFSGLDAFEAYLDAGEMVQQGSEPELPPHFALSFETGADLAPELRKEIAHHQWKVAAAEAYPWLFAVEEDLVTRPPTADEVTMSEAIARALCAVLGKQNALCAAWGGSDSVSFTLSIGTHQGDIEVILSAPFERPR